MADLAPTHDASTLTPRTEPTESTRPRGGLRARIPDYPAAVWWMAACNLILWTGRGMVVPFIVIFFSQIIGLSASLVGLGIAAAGIAGIVFVLVIAGLIDRRGGHPVLVACILIYAFAILGHTLATNIWLFFAMTLVMNMSSQVYWPASDSTIASLTDASRVTVAMSALRVANAVGIGLGGLIGGLIVSNGGLPEYRMLFITSAAFVLTAGVLVRLKVPNTPLQARNAEGNHGTWQDVRPDRLYLYACSVLMLMIIGFSQMQVTVPAFLRREAGVDEGMIGLLFLVNTALVILLQLPLAEWVSRHNVGRLLAIAGVMWAGAFAVMLLASDYGMPAAIGVFILFTAGELIFMPATAVIPVRLAPPHLRGRYFSLLSVGWGLSYAIASLLGGVALDLPHTEIMWPILAAFMVLGAVGALRLSGPQRLVPPPPDTTPQPSVAT